MRTAGDTSWATSGRRHGSALPPARRSRRPRRSRDGASRPLLTAASSRFGPVPTWPAQLYTRPDRAQVLAPSPDVAAAASAGDPVAVQILTEAGRHLAETLAAALTPTCRRSPRPPAGPRGRPTLTGALERRFAALRPDAELVPSAGTPLDGALHLARLLAGAAAADAGDAGDAADHLVAHPRG
ncbi:hypothetical protein NKG05_22865 [Oerskovia sp. M15]